ncbi:MAG TPA: hypothetical protein VFZ61_09280 [Polyangiales bacterium]
MSHGSHRSGGSTPVHSALVHSALVLVPTAFVLAACDPSFDTDWRKQPTLGDAGELDAAPPPPDAEPPPPDAPEFDGSAPPLPTINCSAVLRDASLVSCETDCFGACSQRCSDAAAGCGDAAFWLPCWQCGDGGPPT